MIPITFLCLSCVVTQSRINDPQFALNEYMRRLSDMSKKEGPIPLDGYGSSAFAQSICESQNLVEQGNYGEAAKILAGLLTDKIESDWKEMLQTRITVLRKWDKSGRIELNEYSCFYLETGPRWFHHRTQPIVKLWNMRDIPIVEKYLLISWLLEKKEDQEGLAIVLEAIPGLAGIGELVAAKALLKAGSARYTLKDVAGAERNWSTVMKAYTKTPEWAAAVFNLGRLHRDKKSYTKAIELFLALLEPRPLGRPTGDHTRDAYDNHPYYAALEISGCYEALKDYSRALQYAEQARTRFPFQSGCGTCERGQRKRLARIIEDLKKLQLSSGTSPSVPSQRP